MAETRNIVILGASNAGLSAAHYLARHILPKLQKAEDVNYVLHLVDPSTHFWWHIAAPRAIVSVKDIKHTDYFVPVLDGFKQYPQLKDSLVFHQGTAETLSPEARTVTLKTQAGTEETLAYYALIIATGIRSPTPLTTLHGDHTISQRALEEMNTKLATAKDIVIGGGGPIAVETAGEIATHYKGKANVTLVAGGSKLIPVFRESRGRKVQKQLEKHGVKVLYSTRVQSTTESPEDGKTRVELSNGETLTADVYIPAVGVTPNTAFLPAALRKENGYVATNPTTLRVDAAGPRVYAVGDVADVNLGGMLHLFDVVPVLGANLAHDLLADARLGPVSEKAYQRKDGETQLIPIGRKGGVAAFNGMSLPSFMVAQFKGKDYMKGQIPGMTRGEKWKKP